MNNTRVSNNMTVFIFKQIIPSKKKWLVVTYFSSHWAHNAVSVEAAHLKKAVFHDSKWMKMGLNP